MLQRINSSLLEEGRVAALDASGWNRSYASRSYTCLTGKNLDRFEVLSADKDYDDRSYRAELCSRGKRPLIKHRGFAPYDKVANA